MKEYKIKVLFDVEQIITDLKELVQNDYNTTKLNFTFDKEGRVLFKMSYPDGTQYVDEIENNELVFGKGVLNQEGTYEYEIALYTEDGRLTNHAIGKFEVRSELVNTDELVEVDDRVPVLDNLISEVNTIKQDVEEGKYNGKDGTDGQDGVTPTIGENGNWFIGDVDTGLPSQGPEGKPGPAGGVTLEEVTAITGDPQKLETESKQLVGAINEVLNSSSGITELVDNEIDLKTFETGVYIISGKNTKIKYRYDQTDTSVFSDNTTKNVLIIGGTANTYGRGVMYTCNGATSSAIMVVYSNGVKTTYDLGKMATKSYVDTAIANAITTTLEGSY